MNANPFRIWLLDPQDHLQGLLGLALADSAVKLHSLNPYTLEVVEPRRLDSGAAAVVASWPVWGLSSKEMTGRLRVLFPDTPRIHFLPARRAGDDQKVEIIGDDHYFFKPTHRWDRFFEILADLAQGRRFLPTERPSAPPLKGLDLAGGQVL